MRRNALVLLSFALACSRMSAKPAAQVYVSEATPSATETPPSTPAPTATPTAAPTATPDAPIPTPVPYGGPAEGIWLPVVPTVTTHGIQGVQSRLVSVATGARCDDARIAAATNGDALCYAGADGDVHCAGALNGDIPSTLSFTASGLHGVDQILISPHFDPPWVAGASAICVHETNGTAWCRGSLEFREGGQFNLGDAGNPGATWTQWGTRSDIVELVTGMWGQMCARYADGTADCVGWLDPVFLPQLPPHSFPSRTPVTIAGPSPAAASLWIDSLNRTHVNDPSFVGISSDSFCRVDPATGVHCDVGPIANGPAVATDWGTPGAIVEGGFAGNVGGPPTAATVCWLDTSGAVTCEEGGLRPYFVGVPGHAIALVVSGDFGHEYLDEGGLHPGSIAPRCAVFDDGSLWCTGRDPTGAFGIGSTVEVSWPVQSAPPGSVQIHCAPATHGGDDGGDDDHEHDGDHGGDGHGHEHDRNDSATR